MRHGGKSGLKPALTRNCRSTAQENMRHRVVGEPENPIRMSSRRPSRQKGSVSTLTSSLPKRTASAGRRNALDQSGGGMG